MISVIVPVHNAERYLDRCLRSLLDNTCKDLEIILVENGSSDRSPEICRSYEEQYPQIKVIIADQTGVSHARNLGMKAAAGEFISFVDADDYVSPYLYETVLPFFADPECRIVIFQYKKGPADSFDWKQGEAKVSPITRDQYYHDMYVHGNGACIATWAKVFRRDILGDTEYDETISFTEDRLFYSMLCAKLPVIHVTNAVLYYYYDNNSGAISKNKKEFEKRASQVRSIEKAIAFFEENYPQDRLWQESAQVALLQESDYWTKKFKEWDADPSVIRAMKDTAKKAAKSLRKAKKLPLSEKFWTLCSHDCPGLSKAIYSVYKKVKR